jgi:NADPH-dependent 2,4-dienoyl-CoA reductase/sulfur reductase-like enzyme
MALKEKYDVIVIGSGPSGLGAAIAAKKAGAEDVLIIERDKELGGILLQCIHNGFGTEIFKEDLPGPKYAQRFAQEALSLGVETLLDAMVLDITPLKHIYATSKWSGFVELEARSIVLAMGCRERTRSQIRTPGTRPAGVYTAGTAQRFVNVEGFMPGKHFVILGSGDIGMIMARRLTLEGAKIERVLEIMPFLTGLTRNYVQCLNDFDIPLQLSHTVNRIIGNKRVEEIESIQVDEQMKPIPGTEEIIPADTLLLSVGLIPENELSKKAGVKLDPITGGPFVNEEMQTNVPGIFSTGNVVHVYDLVDWVTEAGYIAGRSAAKFALAGKKKDLNQIKLQSGNNIHHIIPHMLDKESLSEGPQRLQMRVIKPMEEKVWVEVIDRNNLITRKLERYVRPGEMVTIDIPQKAYDMVQRATILTVNIVNFKEGRLRDGYRRN